MSDSCPLPVAAADARARLDELRRFHLGGGNAPGAGGLRPAAFVAGAFAGGEWPIAVDVDAADPRDFVRPGAVESAEAPASRIEAGRSAPLELATLAARRHGRRARAAFVAEAAELAAAAAVRLEADRELRPEGASQAARVDRLGALGARFFDAGRRVEIAGRGGAAGAMEAERRRRLEAACALLGRLAATDGEPLWIVPAEFALDLGAPARSAADPLAAAEAAWDERAAELLPVFAAARLVRLELEDAFDAEQHLPALARLGVRGLADGELALVPPVLALARIEDLLAGGLVSLSRLLLSGKPVQVIVLLDERDGAASGVRLEPALLGIGHREAYVQQGSTALPTALAAGFVRALASGRPSLHVVDAPGGEPDEAGAAALAAARLAGRVAPVFRFEPEAGASWSRRLLFADNPEPLADWPLLPAADSAAPFTFADAALLDPTRRGEFAAAGVLEADELVPLADWLDLDPAAALRRLPFVWAADAAGARARLVVSRRLALEAADRRAFWRTLQELAGVRSERLDEAVAAATAAADERWRAERSALEESHRVELEKVRAEAGSAVVERLVAGLLEPALGGRGG